jgi:hypothetical protein
VLIHEKIKNRKVYIYPPMESYYLVFLKQDYMKEDGLKKEVIRKMMNTKIAAILLVSIVAMAMIVPMAMGDEEAITSAKVINAPPTVDSVSVSPENVEMNPGPDTTPITVNATVSDTNGYEDLTNVNITSFNPDISDVTRPIAMTYVTGSGSGSTADYTATIDLPCCTGADSYTMTVEAKDAADETGTGTGTFNVLSTVAITVGDVDFDSVAPGNSSTASSTVECMGNAEIEFIDEYPSGYNNDLEDGICWSDMTSGANTIADDQISTTWNSADTISCGNAAEASFTLNVPDRTPTGTYTGTITFTPSPAA